MAVAVTHVTPADGTFTPQGRQEWEREHSVTGLGTLATQDGTFSQAGWTFATAGADAAPAMAVNTFYRCDISGYTGDKTGVLPAVAAEGDRIGIFLTAGDDAFELLLTAAAGDTLDLVAGGTEWSRLFIRNECVILRCIVANTTWIVEYDGRIAQRAVLRLATVTSATEAAATYTVPTSISGVWTVDVNDGSIADAANSKITLRRACRSAIISAEMLPLNNLAADKYASVGLFLNAGETQILRGHLLAPAASNPTVANAKGWVFAAGDYVVYKFRTEEGSKGLNATNVFSVTEIL